MCEHSRHAAEAGQPCEEKSGTNEQRDGEEPRRDGEPENRTDKRETTRSDPHLPLQLDGLPGIDRYRQTRLAPRLYAWETTVEEQRQKNVHVRDGVEENTFVAMRTKRDATLSAPTLLLPSIQLNMRAGKCPPAEANGVRYLKIPVKFKSAETAA